MGTAGASIDRPTSENPRCSASMSQTSVSIPSKITVGKANVKRDLAYFVGFMVCLLVVSIQLQNVGRREKEPGGILHLDKIIVEKILERNAGKMKRTRSDCGLYLAPSSIPGAGFGVFAGREILEGDIVIGTDSSVSSNTLDVSPGCAEERVVSSSDDGVIISLSQHQLLLKYHPFLGNVEDTAGGGESSSPGDEDAVLVASKRIPPGAEVFVGIGTQYPTDVVSNVPVPSLRDYELADEIVQDEIKVYLGSKRKKTSSAGALQHTQRVVSKFNKKVAMLLPTTTDALKTAKTKNVTSAFSSLKNRTLAWLDQNGQCLDNVYVKATEGTKGVFARRPIKKGALVMPVPLYVAEFSGGSCDANGGNECGEDLVSRESSHGQDTIQQCFGLEDAALLFCPLSAAVFIRHHKQSTHVGKGPNAQYQWSSQNKANKEAHKLSVEGVLKDYALSLSFDVVASNDISEGEEITMDYGWNGANSHLRIYGGEIFEKFPEAWKVVS